MEMKCYVIIPQFLVTDELVTLAENCIKTYREFSDCIVISVDDAGEYPKAARADEVLDTSDYVVRYEKNKGFAGACNAGFKKAFELSKEDCFIICSNNDIEINKKTIWALKEPFEKFENVAITGIISNKERMWEGKPIDELDWRCYSEGGLLRGYMQDGGLWMSKKSILEKIGLFDERFLRGGYEDVDIFLRARDTFGMKIMMSGRAGYVHFQGMTRWNTEKIGAVNNFGLESKSIEQENLKRFIEKWGFNPHVGQIWKEVIHNM
jgi:GT2 family glycosyltransferase